MEKPMKQVLLVMVIHPVNANRLLLHYICLNFTTGNKICFTQFVLKYIIFKGLFAVHKILKQPSFKWLTTVRVLNTVRKCIVIHACPPEEASNDTQLCTGLLNQHT